MAQQRHFIYTVVDKEVSHVHARSFYRIASNGKVYPGILPCRQYIYNDENYYADDFSHFDEADAAARVMRRAKKWINDNYRMIQDKARA